MWWTWRDRHVNLSHDTKKKKPAHLKLLCCIFTDGPMIILIKSCCQILREKGIWRSRFTCGLSCLESWTYSWEDAYWIISKKKTHCTVWIKCIWDPNLYLLWNLSQHDEITKARRRSVLEWLDENPEVQSDLKHLREWWLKIWWSDLDRYLKVLSTICRWVDEESSDWFRVQK